MYTFVAVKRTTIYLLGMAMLILSCYSCTTNEQLSKQNLSQIYRTTDKQVKPEFMIYHNSSSESELHFKLKSENLLYVRSLDSEEYRAKVKITFILYKSFNSNMVSDSGSFYVQDINSHKSSKEILGKVPIKAVYPSSYIMKITTRDINKKTEEDNFLVVDKTSRQGRQNYLITHAKDSTVKFGYFGGSSEKLRIKYNDEMVKKLSVKLYQRNFKLSPPPFAVYSPKRFDFTPDSLFYVTLDENNSFVLDVNKVSLFHLQVDSTSKEGLTYIRFEDYFPEIMSAKQMVEPMRFVTTNKEFKRLEEEEIPKDAVDEFWISASSSPDRARELIRNYYNRVEQANYYFSTHIEGWKTDRGIIFIVFGPPDVIYKDVGGESWIYGSGKNEPTLSFNYTRAYNPFSGNDYRLERSPEYKNYWYKSVDTWRQGRVYKY